MRLRAAAILLVLGASALRDEIDRLALQVGENEQLSYQKEASRGISQLEDQQQIAQPFGPTAEAFINEGAVDPTVLESAAPRKVLSEKSCRNGILHLQGTVVVKEKLIFSKDCTVLRGEPGSQVIFFAPVIFQGDVQIQGNVQFSAAHGLERACLTVEKNANVTGKIRFQNCHNKNEAWKFARGGGLYVSNLSQHGGTIEFHNCSGKWGGGLYVHHQLSQHGGTIEFHSCSSKEGSGLYVLRKLSQHSGTMKFHDCSSNSLGGGLYVRKLSQHSGMMEFHNCTSSYGGGLYGSKLSQHSGMLKFHNCTGIYGGGLYVYNDLSQHSGTMKFHNCTGIYGGGLYVSMLLQHGGTTEFHNCSSSSRGGCLYGQLSQHSGTMKFHNCSSKEGGCLYGSNLSQHGGTTEFHNCSSSDSGGGMRVAYYESRGGTTVLNHCTASKDGGGLWVQRFRQPEANTSNATIFFNHCSATRGGGIFADTINSTQTLHFNQCRASESGGGLQIIGDEGSEVGNARFENCSADRATAIEARSLAVQHLELVDTFDMAILAQSLKLSTATFYVTVTAPPTLSVEAGTLELDSELDCTKLRECRLSVPASSLRCGLGAGVATTPPFGCVVCPEGFTQVENVTSSSCFPCPAGAALCHAAKIQMKPGFMLHENNLSRPPLHCPTKVGCPGGELPVTSESRAMCREGYGDEGCAKCIKDGGTMYLMANSNVLACTPCAEGSLSQLFQWCSFLAQRSILFAVSAASIFRSGRADSVKNRGVYLNQLMAFAAVSGSVVTAVMQTETAQMMKQGVVEYLYSTAVFLSDAISGQGAKSSQCLLSYLSLEQTGVFGVHCLDVAVATFLVLVLSFKDWRVALVAGLNCFLPIILADFAKYAVCYRLEEDQRDGTGGLICNHLPFGNGSILGFLVVGAGFLTVFAVALFVWISLSSPSEDCKEGDPPPAHEAFLTKRYGEGRQYFEAERLVRKVLLATAAAFFPSTTFPALQMTALLVIICASLVLYAVFQPYRQQLWNWSEAGLLGTALLLIGMASAVIANEDRWDKTELGQKSMVITLGVIVTSVCICFVIKIASEVWQERQPAQAH